MKIKLLSAIFIASCIFSTQALANGRLWDLAKEASQSGDWSQVEHWFCFDPASNFNWAPERSHETVLSLVLKANNFALASKMLAHDRVPSDKNQFAVWKAAIKNDWEALTQLIPKLDKPFNWDGKFRRWGSGLPDASFLWLAAFEQKWPVVRLMLQNNLNANIDATPSEPKFEGWSVLWLAAIMWEMDIVNMMLETHPGANINTYPTVKTAKKDRLPRLLLGDNLKFITVATQAARAKRWDIILNLLSIDPQVRCGVSFQRREEDIALKAKVAYLRDLLVFVASIPWSDRNCHLSDACNDVQRQIALYILKNDEQLPELLRVPDDLLINAVNSAGIRALAVRGQIKQHPGSASLCTRKMRELSESAAAAKSDIDPLFSELCAIDDSENLSKGAKARQKNKLVNTFINENNKRKLDEQAPPAKRHLGDQFFGELNGRFFTLIPRNNPDPSANDPILARLGLTREEAIYRLEDRLGDDPDELVELMRQEVLMVARAEILGIQVDDLGQVTGAVVQNYYRQSLGNRDSRLTPYFETPGLIGAIVNYGRTRLVIWDVNDDLETLRPLHVYGSEFEHTVHLLRDGDQFIELAEPSELVPMDEDRNATDTRPIRLPPPEGPRSSLSSSSSLFSSI